ncbi:MAG: hypothetical protein WCR36_06420 [Bacteroidaceae bacterium]
MAVKRNGNAKAKTAIISGKVICGTTPLTPIPNSSISFFDDSKQSSKLSYDELLTETMPFILIESDRLFIWTFITSGIFA